MVLHQLLLQFSTIMNCVMDSGGKKEVVVACFLGTTAVGLLENVKEHHDHTR